MKVSFRDRLSQPVLCRPFRLWHLLVLAFLSILIPVVVLAAYFSSRPHYHPVDIVVDLDYAQYRGVAQTQNVTSWLGIRYARPPTGQYRFAPPEDPISEAGIVNANTLGPVCISATNPLKDATDGKQSEDCLYMNIFAPTSANTGSKLPVYVFIQGGGFNANANANFNGSALVQSADLQAVVVNFNYRVGAYGFLATSAMADNDTYAYNAGLLDQRQALKWVQKHIRNFGGDPDHVTLGGASAGASSVLYHLTAYDGRDDGLFHAAAAESQGFPALFTVAQSERMFEALAENANCKQSTAKDKLDCLRQLPVVDFQSAHRATRGPYPDAKGRPLWYWGPTLDNDLITDYSYNLFRNGKFLKVPAIFGDATNEATIFTPRQLSNQSAADDFVNDQYPGLTAANFDSLHEVFHKGAEYAGTGAWFSYGADLLGMTRYICPGTFVLDAYAKAGVENIWNYRWNVMPEKNKQNGMGATHVGELGPVWYGGPGVSTNDVHRKWASFIRSFNPNTFSGSQTEWEPWGGVGGNNRILWDSGEVKMEKVDQATLDKCNVLHNIGAVAQAGNW